VERASVPAGGFRRIAVLRLSSLGDVILALPVVRALGRAYPEAQLAFWTKEEYADVVRFDPTVAHVRRLERDARAIEDVVSMGAELEDCDLIVDLHGNLRARVLTARQRGLVLRSPSYRLRRARWVHARWSRPRPLPHALERYAMALSPLGLSATEPPRVAVGDEARTWVGEWLGDWAGEGPLVAFCPGARHGTKRWPEEHWVALHREVRERGARVLVVSLAAERRQLPALAEQVERDAGSRWACEPLARLAALLERCPRAVTHDSGVMHLAAACGARVVALFGSTSPVLGFAPAGPDHVVLCRDERCQPCTLHGRAECPRRHFDCMRRLEPRSVLQALLGPGAPRA
jgi:heptosyltransferase II